MKKKSPPYAIIIAAVLGIVAVIAFVQYTKSQEAAKAEALAAADKKHQDELNALRNKQQPTIVSTPTDTRAVLYATQPMEAGAKVSPAFYEKKQTPNDILPDAFNGDSDITGWVAIRKIEKGDPLTPRNIGKSLPYMSQRITPGMRALSLKVFNAGDVNDTGGFAVDGDRVDLLYTRTSDDSKIEYDTGVAMQNLQILYVPGPPIKTEKTDGINPVGEMTITFEVTPEQAQALVFMSQGSKSGHFSMILRARKDQKEINIKPFTYEFYTQNLNRVQKMTDKSIQRVDDLAKEIEAQEKASQGTSNETTNPTPPKP